MNILLSAYSCHLLIVMSVTLFDSHGLNQYPYMRGAQEYTFNKIESLLFL